MEGGDHLLTRLQQANAGYAATFEHADLDALPGRSLAIVTCMDARLPVLDALGLEVGEAHVIRNAGGVVTDDVLRSLVLSQRRLGTSHIILIHHTGCGVEGFDEDALREELAAETDTAPPWQPATFDDPYEDVRDSLRRLRKSSLLRHRESIYGFVYDVGTGRLAEVVAD